MLHLNFLLYFCYAFADTLKKIFLGLGLGKKWTSQNNNLTFFHLIKEPIKSDVGQKRKSQLIDCVRQSDPEIWIILE